MEEPVDSRYSRGWYSICLPFLKWRPRVTRTTLRADLIAGLTGAILALPQGVAFATIAGMPPQYGLYAGMVLAIVAALFGSPGNWCPGRQPRHPWSCFRPSAKMRRLAALTMSNWR